MSLFCLFPGSSILPGDWIPESLAGTIRLLSFSYSFLSIPGLFFPCAREPGPCKISFYSIYGAGALGSPGSSRCWPQDNS